MWLSKSEVADRLEQLEQKLGGMAHTDVQTGEAVFLSGDDYEAIECAIAYLLGEEL